MEIDVESFTSWYSTERFAKVLQTQAFAHTTEGGQWEEVSKREKSSHIYCWVAEEVLSVYTFWKLKTQWEVVAGVPKQLWNGKA